MQHYQRCGSLLEEHHHAHSEHMEDGADRSIPQSPSRLGDERLSIGAGSGGIHGTASRTVPLQSISEHGMSQGVTPHDKSNNYSDPALDDALHELLGDGTCSGEDEHVLDETTRPCAFDLWHYFFPPFLSQPELPSSQTTGPEALRSTQSHYPIVT